MCVFVCVCVRLCVSVCVSLSLCTRASRTELRPKRRASTLGDCWALSGRLCCQGSAASAQPPPQLHQSHRCAGDAAVPVGTAMVLSLVCPLAPYAYYSHASTFVHAGPAFGWIPPCRKCITPSMSFGGVCVCVTAYRCCEVLLFVHPSWLQARCGGHTGVQRNVGGARPAAPRPRRPFFACSCSCSCRYRCRQC